MNTPEKLQRWASYTAPPIQSFTLGDNQHDFSILRLDQISSWASGNKYFKLKYVIREVLDQGISTIISKGGMFSNHLEALSAACMAFDVHLVAVIRSYGADEMNPSIIRLRENGHEIIFIPPATYSAFSRDEAVRLYPDALFIPEGGLSDVGIKGSREIATACLNYNPTHILITGGTMATACGLMSALPSTMKLIIVPAWKGCTEDYIFEILSEYQITTLCSWELWPDFHFGGFGRFDQRLITFMHAFSSETGIPLDPVYTGKMLYALHTKSSEGYFGPHDRVLAIHTGGLQGLEGFRYRFPEEWGAYLRP